MAIKIRKIPRDLAMCHVDYDYIPPEEHAHYIETFKPQDKVIFLGEIPNMPSRCVVLDMYNKIHIGWNMEIFKECATNKF